MNDYSLLLTGIITFFGYSVFFLFLRNDVGFKNERRAWLYYALAALASFSAIGNGIIDALNLGPGMDTTYLAVNTVAQLYVIFLLIRSRR